jgi:hypothetical protein
VTECTKINLILATWPCMIWCVCLQIYMELIQDLLKPDSENLVRHVTLWLGFVCGEQHKALGVWQGS